MKDTQNLADSIEVRSLEIVRLILLSGKAKNEDGVKIHKEDADLIAKQINKVLVRINRREEEVKQLERNLFGISDSEIKLSQKQAKFKNKEQAYHLEILEKFKVDVGEMVKKDKLRKYCEKQLN